MVSFLLFLANSLRILRDSQAAVVNQNDGLRLLKLLLDAGDDSLLHFEIVGHILTPHIPVQS